ncbi:MAG: YicC/YloC family endoribonuclease [Spirochaetales bacterium]
MKSMTGHAWHEWQDDTTSVSVELKSYNNRYLDVNVQLPPRLSPIEPALRARISSAFSRGKIECFIRTRSIDQPVSVRVDNVLAAEYARALRALSQAAGLEGEPSLSDLMSFEGVISTELKVDVESWQALIEPKLTEAIHTLAKSRAEEGARMYEVILDQRRTIETLVDEVDARAEDLEEHIRSSILDRFRQLSLEGVDDTRAVSETAVLLVKYSVREELDRLRSHLASFDATTREDGAIGKRLDFICQEIGREINTIGSKSVFSDVNAAVVRAKDALENIREQLRNVE